MRQPLQLVIGLLACLALASARPGLFPRNNIMKYRYYADLKTGTIEPTPYASQFVTTGFMYVTPEVRDPNLTNAFYIVLNVTHGIRNGEIQHFEKIQGNTFPLPEAASMLNDPFIVIFDDDGMVKSLMMNQHEPGWSRNMKKSIASMLQLDLSSMQLETPMKPHGFLTKENTIYGECAVAYDVHRTLDLEEDHFTVTKIMNPMSCDGFNQHTFNFKESQGCLVEAEEEMTSASRRVFQIKKTGKDLLIEKLVAHGVINYFPWRAKSEAHYILANQTMELESILPMDSLTLPEFNMTGMMILNDVTFQKSESLYAVHAGVDHTHGRHVINLGVLIAKLIRMLGEATDYMNENNLEMTSPEMKHGQTMNRILHTMTRMDLPSLEHIFNNIIDGTSLREVTMTKLFLNMLPYVGTNATCLFTRNIIRKHKIPDQMAVNILTKLPFHIRVPMDALLIEMEGLMKLGNDTSLEVRKAGILCFATMIYKTHRHDSYSRTMDGELLNRYLQYYFDHVISEPTFEMKMVFLQAMRNIEVGDVHKLLEPIIRGEQQISEKPEYLRLHAMLVNWKTIRDVEYIHDLYWPILSDTQLPLELRICAYFILMEQPPRMERLMNMYWFMVYEKNEHLYNYHYTTMRSLAKMISPCMTPMKEMVRKILRFTRVRPVSGIMTGAWVVDFQNKKFGFGDAMSVRMVADEHTGMPYAGFIEYASTNNRRPVNEASLFLRVEGVDALQSMIFNITLENQDLSMEEIERVLSKAREDMPRQKPIHIEICIVIQGRTVYVAYFDRFPNSLELMTMILTEMNTSLNLQTIHFEELYTKEVPNDLGLPSILRNSIPRVMSIQSTNEVNSKPLSMYDLNTQTVMKIWRHGCYSMEVYNPIIDTWHAMRHMSAYDGSLSIAMSISYNYETKSLKLNFPRLPLTQYSISGVRSYVKNYVMIMEAEDGILEQYCGTCRQAELVTRGIEHRKNTTLMNLDSKDVGLRLSMYRYDCERVFPARPQAETLAQWMDEEDKNTWDNNAILAAMVLREDFLHVLISPELGTCGYFARLEPSIIYPASEVDITMRMSFEMPPAKMLSLLPASRITLRGTLDTKVAATNISGQSWTMNANMVTSQGYINNQLQVQLTRITPGQKDMKVCIDGYKIYPTQEVDPLNRVSTTKQEVMGKLTMTIGETDNGTCVRDGVSIIINMKGEMSDEQKDALKHELTNGLCQKDIENPIYLYAESSIVPRTPSCLREAILYSYLRKYSYTIFYKNIPESIKPTLHSMVNDLRGSIEGDVTYLPAHTEPGIMKIFTEYLLNNEGINVTIRTPIHEEIYTGINRYKEKHTGFGGLSYTESDFAMENTRFSWSFLNDMENNRIKFCVIYPEVLLNTDGAVMPFIVPGQWTLVTADYMRQMFSVFVKRLEPKKLGLLMTAGNHTLQVIPSATIPTVTVDGNVIDYVSGVTVFGYSSYALRTTWSQNRLVIQSTYTSFDLEWTERSVSLAMKTNLQGKVTGLCGHLDGTHTERMPKVYTFGQ